MSSIIDTVSKISTTMDILIDFIAQDEFLGAQFEKYLEKNKIEINSDLELNNILIEYLLTSKIETGEHVIDYFKSKTNFSDNEILNSLKNAFVSVFQIKKISQNLYSVYDLACECNLDIMPLVKTTTLRGVGRFDYITARIIEYKNTLYLLEVIEVVSQFKEFEANLEAVRRTIQNPKIAVLNDREKLLKIKNSISSFHSSFMECFNKNEFVVSNKETDKIIDDFYKFHTGKIDKIEYIPLDDNFDYKFFEVEEYENDILLNATHGFISSSKEYDVGFYSDLNFGLFVIPFLGTFNKILSLNDYTKVEDGLGCVKDFILSDKIPPDFLIKKEKEYGTLLKMINEIFNKNFDTIDEAASFYKNEYNDGLRLSPITILYESKALSYVMGYKEETNKFENVGRNELCPCGSGKKYKKCCLNKGEHNG